MIYALGLNLDFGTFRRFAFLVVTRIESLVLGRGNAVPNSRLPLSWSLVMSRAKFLATQFGYFGIAGKDLPDFDRYLVTHTETPKERSFRNAN